MSGICLSFKKSVIGWKQLHFKRLQTRSLPAHRPERGKKLLTQCIVFVASAGRTVQVSGLAGD